MRTLVFISALAILALAGCSRPDTESAARDALSSDTLTQDQRDSILGESGIPGAAGVRSARGASDASATRNARLDSIAGSAP